MRQLHDVEVIAVRSSLVDDDDVIAVKLLKSSSALNQGRREKSSLQKSAKVLPRAGLTGFGIIEATHRGLKRAGGFLSMRFPLSLEYGVGGSLTASPLLFRCCGR